MPELEARLAGAATARLCGLAELGCLSTPIPPIQERLGNAISRGDSVAILQKRKAAFGAAFLFTYDLSASYLVAGIDLNL